LSGDNRYAADEAELIQQAKKGDQQAFAVLVRHYQRRLFGVALALTRNPDDAAELAQEAFVRAYQNLGQFEARSSFSTWLYRIVANLAIDLRRRESRHVVLRGEEAESELRRLAGSGDTGFNTTFGGELRGRLRAALDELTPEHRAVILLREVEGLSYEEISETLGCPRGTVMSRLHYARMRLREQLKDFRHR
jgi:RNA polymerase sigma-70 factor (ECF subfamily)